MSPRGRIDTENIGVKLIMLLYGWTPIPGEGPFGKGPGVGSWRSSEPAGGTGQTEKGWAEGRLQGGGHRKWDAQQRGGGYHSTESGALRGARRQNKRRANRRDSSIFLSNLKIVDGASCRAILVGLKRASRDDQPGHLQTQQWLTKEVIPGRGV